jgi:hypothetical protein
MGIFGLESACDYTYLIIEYQAHGLMLTFKLLFVVLYYLI